jgi:DNA-directed RNA polymerase specialized sigma24 family protein
MSTDPNYQSEEELLRRLQQHLAEAAGADTRPARRARLAEEANAVVLILADRIYSDARRWGLGNVPPNLREDVAQDTLLNLLQNAGAIGGRENTVADWFGKQSERRFRILWRTMETAAQSPREPELISSDRVTESSEPVAGPGVDEPDGPWHKFEQEFPRDAFVLRLRYILRRSPGDMAIMLDAPNINAINSRLTRARGRMLMFFEQSGFDQKAITEIMDQFGENSG